MARTIRASRPESAWGCTVAIDDKFIPLIQKLEAQSLVDAKAYRRALFWRALLGYGYIFTILIGLVLLIALVALVAFLSHHFNVLIAKLVFILAIPAFMIAKSLFVKWDPPQGLEVKSSEAPKLFSLIEEVRRKTKGPKPHKVLITNEFNASVTQYPRLGIFGWNQNYVMLGLPLMQALSLDEVKSVLAHEFGHLSGSHSAFSSWVYRVRQTWAQLSLNLGEGVAGAIMNRFFRWYGPWFNAYSFVMARADEYEADAVSVEVTNSKTVASTLARVELEARRYDDFWQDVWNGALTSPKPTKWPMALLPSYLQQPFKEGAVLRYTQQALAVKTDIHNTHPSISDRLKAIGEAMPVLQPVPFTGAEQLFDPSFLQATQQKLDQKWWYAVEAHWVARHEDVKADREKLEVLRQKEVLSDDEALDMGLIFERLEHYPEAKAVALKYQATITDKNVQIPMLLLEIRVLHALEDAEAVKRAQALLEMPLSLKFKGYVLSQVIDTYSHFSVPEDEIQAVKTALNEAYKKLEKVNLEFNTLNEKMPLEAHDLPDEAIHSLKVKCATFGAIKHIWLGLRRSQYDPEQNQYVAVVEMTMFNKAEDKIEEALNLVISVLNEHGHVFAMPLASDTAWLKTRLSKLSNAQVR